MPTFLRKVVSVCKTSAGEGPWHTLVPVLAHGIGCTNGQVVQQAEAMAAMWLPLKLCDACGPCMVPRRPHCTEGIARLHATPQQLKCGANLAHKLQVRDAALATPRSFVLPLHFTIGISFADLLRHMVRTRPEVLHVSADEASPEDQGQLSTGKQVPCLLVHESVNSSCDSASSRQRSTQAAPGHDGVRVEDSKARVCASQRQFDCRQACTGEQRSPAPP